MKHLYSLAGASILALAVISCNIVFNGETPDSQNIRFVPGELLVEMNHGYTSNDLDSLLADLEPGRGGGFSSAIHRVVVPEGRETHWVALLDKEEIIRTAQLNRFGYSYNLAEKDGYPYLQGDSLHVWVGYSGCDPDVDFSLEHARTGPSFYEVWLFKEEETDCAAAWIEERAFKVPDEVRHAQSVRIIKPIDKRIVLIPPPMGGVDSIIGFGDPYTLHQRDGYPYLQGDFLHVWITYTGCGGETVSLKSSRTGPSSYDIWLHLEERVITCQAEVGMKGGIRVPDEIRAALSVQLITPQGDRIELKN